MVRMFRFPEEEMLDFADRIYRLSKGRESVKGYRSPQCRSVWMAYLHWLIDMGYRPALAWLEDNEECGLSFRYGTDGPFTSLCDWPTVK